MSPRREPAPCGRARFESPQGRAQTLMALAVSLLVVVLLGVLSNGRSSHRAETAVRPGIAPAQAPAGLSLTSPRGRRCPRRCRMPRRSPCGWPVLLFGGLDASDTSTTAVTAIAHDHLSILGRLPLAQHDAQGCDARRRAYIFGGGEVSSYDHVLHFYRARGRVSPVGALPTAGVRRRQSPQSAGAPT